MLLATYDSTGYNIVLAIHVLSVVIGFGGVALVGILTRAAVDQAGPVGGGIATATAKLIKVAEYAIFTVPLWGIALVVMSKTGNGEALYGFGTPWVSASFTLYLLALAISLGFLRPATARFTTLTADAGTRTEAAALGRQIAAASGVANLLWIVVLFLMVLKPGQ